MSQQDPKPKFLLDSALTLCTVVQFANVNCNRVLATVSPELIQLTTDL